MNNSNNNQSSSIRWRIRGAIVLAGVIALLGAALYLQPKKLENPFGHAYSFLPPCGFLYHYGYPCPTCYMTRAFTYMMHGRPDLAFKAQPFGALLCLLVIYLGWGAARTLITGRGWQPVWGRWPRKWLILGFIAAFLAGWIFRVAYGTFITHEFPLHVLK